MHCSLRFLYRFNHSVVSGPAKALLGLLVVLLSACSTPFAMNLHNYRIKSESLSAAWTKLSQYEYKARYDSYWKSPTEFTRDGGGNCSDFSVYMCYLLGPDAYLCIIRLNDASENHAIVEYQGWYIEPQVRQQVYLESEFRLIERDSYTEVMQKATLYGLKGLGNSVLSD
jgi:hypothetical protein